jgi:hypothetical protein
MAQEIELIPVTVKGGGCCLFAPVYALFVLFRNASYRRNGHLYADKIEGVQSAAYRKTNELYPEGPDHYSPKQMEQHKQLVAGQWWKEKLKKKLRE